MKQYNVIGVMSGTSCDGIDIAYSQFVFKNAQWHFKLIKAYTYPYDDLWGKRLKTIINVSANELAQFHYEYGYLIGEKVKEFITQHALKVNFIASHGHTVFHQPEKRYTLQIGHGSAIASICKLPVICDFRSLDVALKGQGAPLVPIGDQLLFGEYDYCLNLGGFANVSFQEENIRYAYDICPCNMVLNYFAEQLNKKYDDGGSIAQSGKINTLLLNKLNQLAFYKKNYPKSLGKEWVEEYFMPVLFNWDIPIVDKMRTVTEHFSQQIAYCIGNHPKKKVLVTGGGAYNRLLIDCIKKYSSVNIIIPDAMLINFKEALIFAFLGVLRMKGENNCLTTVTGATKDSSSGAIYLA